MTDLLMGILIGAYPKPTDEPEPAPTCEWCGEPHEDLQEVDDSDPSVGYYSKLVICATCIGKRRIEKARW